MIVIDQKSRDRVMAGRLAVEVYREAHGQLHSGGWYREIHNDHTPLLKKMIATLEKIGIASTEPEFEPKKTEILRKLWDGSDLLNIQELGFIDREDFKLRATLADMEVLEGMWR